MTARILMFLTAFLVSSALPAHADDARVTERMIGKADSPLRIDEYVSMTCPHCATFTNDILPQIEKNYVETGKAHIVFHTFVRDGADLRAVTLAYCMPEDQFFPFVGVLFKNQSEWVLSSSPDKILTGYAKLGGLAEDKAKACLADKKLMDAVIADSMKETSKYEIHATPTFIINYGADKIEGDRPYADMAAAFDRLLAANKDKKNGKN